MKIYRDRMLTVRFWLCAMAAMAMALLVLSGCTLERESGNYAPMQTYRWTEPQIWKE